MFLPSRCVGWLKDAVPSGDTLRTLFAQVVTLGYTYQFGQTLGISKTTIDCATQQSPESTNNPDHDAATHTYTHQYPPTATTTRSAQLSSKCGKKPLPCRKTQNNTCTPPYFIPSNTPRVKKIKRLSTSVRQQPRWQLHPHARSTNIN